MKHQYIFVSIGKTERRDAIPHSSFDNTTNQMTTMKLLRTNIWFFILWDVHVLLPLARLKLDDK